MKDKIDERKKINKERTQNYPVTGLFGPSFLKWYRNSIDACVRITFKKLFEEQEEREK